MTNNKNEPVKDETTTAEEIVELTSQNAMLMAAETLNTAAEVAVYNRDIESLLSIAAGWVEIFDRMTGYQMDNGKSDSPVGFGNFRPVVTDGTS